MRKIPGLLLAMTIGLGGCFGGGGGGDPENPMTEISGVVPSCSVDTATAVDQAGRDFAVPLRSDCSFLVNVTPGQTYTMSFEKDSALVARLVANDDPANPQFVFLIDDSARPLDLGFIQIDGDLAFPANDIGASSDFDHDGIPNSDDPDADGDGNPGP
ncbi:MAG TPA: hypothetical protein VJR29_03495 [bacterium]|nr:hypothetical protein [bacterium]